MSSGHVCIAVITAEKGFHKGGAQPVMQIKSICRPSEHKTLDNIYTMLDQRRRRMADVV